MGTTIPHRETFCGACESRGVVTRDRPSGDDHRCGDNDGAQEAFRKAYESRIVTSGPVTVLFLVVIVHASFRVEIPLVHVLGYLSSARPRPRTHLWLLVLAVLHHVVDMAQNRIHRVLRRHVERKERDDVLVLDLGISSAFPSHSPIPPPPGSTHGILGS